MTLPKISNRVKVALTQAPGTGTLSLGAAVSGFQTFDQGGFLNGDTVSYVIEDGTAWEIGTGVYTTSGATLTRNVLSSSNTDGSAINASASATVYNTLLAQNAGISGPLKIDSTTPVNVTQSGVVTTKQQTNGQDVSSTNPLPVTAQGTVAATQSGTWATNASLYVSGSPVTSTNPVTISPTNTVGASMLPESTTLLAAAGVFTGATLLSNGYATNTHWYWYVYADQPGVVRVDAQGTNSSSPWLPAIPSLNVLAGVPVFVRVPAFAYSYRVVYTNGSTAQGTFVIYRQVARMGSI